MRYIILMGFVILTRKSFLGIAEFIGGEEKMREGCIAERLRALGKRVVFGAHPARTIRRAVFISLCCEPTSYWF